MAIASALLCITRRSPVASALWLVNVLFNLSVVYVLLDAHFIAAVQILVYAGAIMVLFLFVIMLLNVGRPGPTDIKGAGGKVIAAVAGLIMLGELIALSRVTLPENLGLPDGAVARMVETQGAVQVIAMPLFQQYLVPFELTSVMLLAAVVGAVVLAKKKI
ncbi:MAG TPA: NADH-quinone oxidoreductase subunit J [Gemmatimonadales bacterium]|jgi:NADH-quinone oxidoreductase subunit J